MEGCSVHFVTQVARRIRNFFQYTPAGQDTLVAAPAVAKAFEDFGQVADAELKPDHIKDLIRFQWMLEPAQKTALDALKEKVEANLQAEVKDFAQ